MPIVIIEPHPDDLIYSCSPLLEYSGPIYVVTHYAGDNRNTMHYRDLGYDIIPIILPVPEIHFDESTTFKYDSDARILGILNLLHKYYDHILSKLIQSSSQIYIPYGIYHPHHMVISKFYNSIRIKYCLVSWYVDRPYYDLYADEETKKFISAQGVDLSLKIDIQATMIKLFSAEHLSGHEGIIKNSIIVGKHPERL